MYLDPREAHVQVLERACSRCFIPLGDGVEPLGREPHAFEKLQAVDGLVVDSHVVGSENDESQVLVLHVAELEDGALLLQLLVVSPRGIEGHLRDGAEGFGGGGSSAQRAGDGRGSGDVEQSGLARGTESRRAVVFLHAVGAEGVAALPEPLLLVLRNGLREADQALPGPVVLGMPQVVRDDWPMVLRFVLRKDRRH